MSMKVTKLYTYWTPIQACDMLELLDELRDRLWESYGDQIIAYRLAELEHAAIDQRQQELLFTEDETF